MAESQTTALLKPWPVRVGEGGEGGHWYVPGPPAQCAYEILGANGKWRATTMRDARKYGWVPGVSSIIRQEAAPGLERWKVRQGIMAALTHPKAAEIEDVDQLIALLETDSKAEAKQAALRGKAIHAAIEQYFQTGNTDPRFAEQIGSVRKELVELIGSDDPAAYEVETAGCHPYRFGGRVDLYSRPLNVVIDLKGKEFGVQDKPKGWPEQGRQLVAYREIVKLPQARLVNLFISRNHPGLVYPYEWPAETHAKMWREFEWLLGFWQCKNGFPGHLRLAA